MVEMLRFSGTIEYHQATTEHMLYEETSKNKRQMPRLDFRPSRMGFLHAFTTLWAAVFGRRLHIYDNNTNSGLPVVSQYM